MARSDRLLRLLQAMRVMAPPITAARLAEETGVSLRSLYRDIDSLRAAGARIEGERGYGYRLVEDYALPPQTFDRIEIEALVLGLGEVQYLGDPELAAAARSALAKVAATLPDEREQQMLHAVSQVYRPPGALRVGGGHGARAAVLLAGRGAGHSLCRCRWRGNRAGYPAAGAGLSPACAGGSGLVLPARGFSDFPGRQDRGGSTHRREFSSAAGKPVADLSRPIEGHRYKGLMAERPPEQVGSPLFAVMGGLPLRR
jgi:biotin operon repressor